MNLFKKLFKEMDAQDVQPIEVPEVKPITVEAVVPTPEPIVSQTQLIEMCHSDFYSSGSKLVQEKKRKIEEYNSIIAKNEQKGKLYEKAGFWDNPIYRNYSACTHNIKHEYAFLEAFEYFEHKYPQHKLITEKGVEAICRKYGLVYSEVRNYIEEVPLKQLEIIANFNKDIPDWSCRNTSPNRITTPYITQEQKTGLSAVEQRYVWKEPFFIAAPKSHFSGHVRFDENTRTIIEDDPIVLAPVVYKGDRYLLVVTAWGLEAQDELIFNGNHN